MSIEQTAGRIQISGQESLALSAGQWALHGARTDRIRPILRREAFSLDREFNALKRSEIKNSALPVPFSAKEVQLILAGQMTEVHVKVPTQISLGFVEYPGKTKRPGQPSKANFLCTANGRAQTLEECPLGHAGDLLWVQEPWTVNLTGDAERGGPGTVPIYRAEHPAASATWRRTQLMPRWASRICLEVVYVELLLVSHISEPMAIQSGVYESSPGRWTKPIGFSKTGPTRANPRAAYWDSWMKQHQVDKISEMDWVWRVKFEPKQPTKANT